ncbi:MAG TPA: MATE family efflux transporter [Clostridiaceae bacterium]|nr:MATE family efflux transporter [Clostridiaceae bacterium]
MRIREDVLKLTAPIVVEQVLTISLGVVNTILASNIGKEAVSAIGMVDAINNVFIAFFSSLAVGGTVVVAQYTGHNDIKDANKASGQAMSSSIIISLAVTLLMWVFRYPIINGLYSSAEQSVLSQSYIYFEITLLTYPLICITLTACGLLRGAGDTKTPMKVNIIMNIINIFLSYILIYGINIRFLNFRIPGLNVEGAALGIALTRVIGSIMIMLVLLKGSKIIKLKGPHMLKVDLNMQKMIFNVGIPSGLESLVFNGGKLITQIFIVYMGTAAIAANYIANSITTLINIPGAALSIAATTLVGQNMGRGDPKNAEDLMVYLTKLSSACLLVVCFLSIPLTRAFCLLYTRSEDVLKMAVNITRQWDIVTPALWSIAFVLPAGLKGAGDATYTLVTSFIGMWIFRITLGYILGIPFKLGVAGIWIGMYVDWAVRGILYWARLKKGKWKNNVVIDIHA